MRFSVPEGLEREPRRPQSARLMLSGFFLPDSQDSWATTNGEEGHSSSAPAPHAVTATQDPSRVCDLLPVLQHSPEPHINEPQCLLFPLRSQVEEGWPELEGEAWISGPRPPAQILPLKACVAGSELVFYSGPCWPGLPTRQVLRVVPRCLPSGTQRS